MSQKRLRGWQKATALVPLALLSSAWTASLTVTSTASAATEERRPLPDGSTVPDEAIEAPASLSRPGEIAPGVPASAARSVIASASTNGIPAAALAAYQRAAEVINSADPSCRIGWQLIAAIGRVESDHGRYGGNVLDDEGRSRPGIYGIPLDGSNGTARITDTDAGQYDDDQVYDRAVGPMQFIPSTWSVVGVDGDGDGVRDPQDIDDAALASAVYLCSGEEDLSTTAGQRTAVYRYNHSQEYVDLVLSIMNAYLDGDYVRVPTRTAAPTVFTPSAEGPATSPAGSAGNRPGGRGGSAGSDGGAGATGPTDRRDGDRDGDGDTTEPPAVPDGPTEEPEQTVDDPVRNTTDDAKDTVQDTVTPLEKATAYCQDTLTSAELKLVGGIEACTDAYLDGGAGAVQALLDKALLDATKDSTGGGLS
jgi:membrane-bound lytic murein transglycosylase B